MSDVETAERLAPGSSTVKSARAAVFAVGATVLASKDNLAEAAKELEVAASMGADDSVVATAKEAIVTGWMARAEAALANKDVKRIKQAVDEAAKSGASSGQLEQLRTQAVIMESLSLASSGNVERAAKKFAEASRMNAAVANAAMEQPASVALRKAVVADHRAKFEAAVGREELENALRIIAAVQSIEPTSWDWVAALSPSAVAALPSSAIAALPPAAIAALPPLRNSIGMQFKLIPPGAFVMGEKGGGKASPHHRVTLTRSFYIGMYEVTNEQWTQVMGGVPSNWKDDERPVENVSWDVAVEFCKKLSAFPEERKAGRTYRLPTEAEWEYACRAGTAGWFSYSFSYDESLFGEYGWFDGNSKYETHPVGRRKPNAWGLFDMHGNVWEWCNDWYGDYGTVALTDPHGPSEGSGRVFRGGCWKSSAWRSRSADRDWQDPSFRGDDLGVRLALSVPDSNPPVAND